MTNQAKSQQKIKSQQKFKISVFSRHVVFLQSFPGSFLLQLHMWYLRHVQFVLCALRNLIAFLLTNEYNDYALVYINVFTTFCFYRVSRTEASAMNELRKIIYSRKELLLKEFRKRDQKQTGRIYFVIKYYISLFSPHIERQNRWEILWIIVTSLHGWVGEILIRCFQSFDELGLFYVGILTILEWGDVMENVLEISLPWIMILNQMSIVKKDGKIDYESSLDRYHIEAMFSKVNNLTLSAIAYNVFSLIPGYVSALHNYTGCIYKIFIWRISRCVEVRR